LTKTICGFVSFLQISVPAQLKKISKEVLYAVTGVEAIEVCRNNPYIDLVLMNLISEK